MSQAECGSDVYVSGDMKLMRIFAGIPWIRASKNGVVQLVILYL